MKILLVNNSGNVGKSFLSRELFLPNMPNAKIVEIETHNSSSSSFKIETIKLNGADIQDLNKLFFKEDDLIVDLGASQIENFFKHLKQVDLSVLDEIDLIVIPVIPNIKEIEDTLVLIQQLQNLNLNIKIEVVLNRCEVLKKFDFFIEEAKERNIIVNTNLVLQDYRAIADLEENKMLTTEILGSDRDYKREAKEAFKKAANDVVEIKTNEDGVEEEVDFNLLGDKISDFYLLQKQSKAIREDLDKVFALLIAKS